MQAGEYKLGSITVRAQLLRDHLRVEVNCHAFKFNWTRSLLLIQLNKKLIFKCHLQVLNARHLKPPEVHRGTLSEKMGRASRLRAKSNINMTRSQKNLDWVKSKFASLKANIHTQVQKRGFSLSWALFGFNLLQLISFRESRSTPQTHRTKLTHTSAFDLCPTQGYFCKLLCQPFFWWTINFNNFDLPGSVTRQSTEHKLSGEHSSLSLMRLLTCEYRISYLEVFIL